jgi:hypothetical protein
MNDAPEPLDNDDRREMLENFGAVLDDFEDGFCQLIQYRLDCSKVEAMQVWLLMRTTGAMELIAGKAIENDDDEEEWKQR